MMRFAAISPIAFIAVALLAGCEDGAGFALPGGASAALEDYPVRKAACVDAVRREVRSVDVRAETVEVVSGETSETSVVVFGLVVGPEAAPWTCTADNAGAVSNVGPVPVEAPPVETAEPSEEA